MRLFRQFRKPRLRSGFEERPRFVEASTRPWKEIFEDAAFLASAHRRIESTGARLVERVGTTYKEHDRLARQLENAALDVIAVIDYCDALESRTEELEAITRRLERLLGQLGIVAWVPSIGDRFGDGCESLRSVPDSQHSAGCIVEVVLKGYRTGAGRVVRRSAVILSAGPFDAETIPDEPHTGQSDDANADEKHSPLLSKDANSEIPNDDHRNRSGHA